ncbi:unnamed protein product (macronuclear) [Paramecium tetraurelia]|uniref:Uncharacterized protein n=1 Tax=Paramecium tetraurelia TaxID=5888 RepID=A0CHS4_PARTE|nr:uncharacterized protein GSPATT00038443001 [Paramecium tetraurelia]CAK70341.1 unnamed protein product [Paramecium tetraurelia]|eukprot:XP_001437738.1 hypothetical protein (macronuclear) [Paramecium tetraurelia strain d4-2]
MKPRKNSCLLKLNQNQLRREKVKQIVVERKDNIGKTVDYKYSQQVQVRKSGFLQTLQ